MSEMVLHAKTLPEALFRLVATEKVRIKEDDNGVIRLIPIKEPTKPVSICPLLGLYADGKLTVEKHHAWSREDKLREEKALER